MKIQKHHIYLIPILGAIAISAALSFFSRSDSVAQTYNIAPTCSYSYSSWSDCSSSGTQTRTITGQTPSGCSGGTIDQLSRSCTFTPPTCSYSYSSWSECSSSGTQNRTIASKTPSGCSGGTVEPLSRSCTYAAPETTVPICAYSYSEWSDCSSSGKQTRTITNKTPSGCSGGTIDQLFRSCTYSYPTTSYSTTTTTSTAAVDTQTTSCFYQCSSWGDCLMSGYQERTCQKPYGTSCTAVQEKRACTYFGLSSGTTESSSSVVCSIQCSDWSICTPAGVKYKNCWPSPAGCSGTPKTETMNCAPTTCQFSYSSWSSCQDGFQFRTILSTSPAQCVGGNPILNQTCAAGETESQTEDQLQTASETVSVPSAPVDPEIAVNDEWKKETFKTVNCQDQICGGENDPDRDGLSNNDEFRYGTNPLKPDTDSDGKKDGEEVALGTDPLKSSAKGEEDQIVFENPKETGTVKENIYQVSKVEMTEESGDGQKKMKLTGKGPANSYLNVFIYSGDPVIVTVKTDSNGDWTYVVDKTLEDGDHQVYVAVTNNSGAIKAKSAPLPFVKTAQAVSMQNLEKAPVLEKTTQKSGISFRSLLIVFALAVFALMLALILIGVVIKKVASRNNPN